MPTLTEEQLLPGSLGFALDEFTDRWNASLDASDELRLEARRWEVDPFTGGGSIGQYSFSGRLPRGHYLMAGINEDGTLRSVALSYGPPRRGLSEADEVRARLTAISAQHALVKALAPSLSADERNHLLEDLWGGDPVRTDTGESDATTAAAGVRFRLLLNPEDQVGSILIGRPDNLGNGTLDPSLTVVLLLKLHIQSDDVEWQPGYGSVLPQDALNLYPVDFVLQALPRERADATAVWRYGTADGQQVEIGALLVDGVAADDVLAAAVQAWSGIGHTSAATQLSIGAHDVVWMLDTGRVMYLYESNGVVHWVASASRSLAESVMENMP